MKVDRAVIEVNGGCNYSCQMCPQGSEQGRGKNWLKKMSLVDFERYVDELQPRIVNLDGSGEATLNFDLHRYIEALTKRGIESYIFSNGLKMHGDYMKRCVDAGLTYYRFSVIGYDQLSYMKWMKKDAFHQIRLNARDMVDYTRGTNTTVASYHLILDPSNIPTEIGLYRDNFIDPTGTKAEIWGMHNWAGSYAIGYERHGEISTCGRPFSADAVVRSGGLDGKRGAVHPCCQVLGKDDDAVLGHLSEQSWQEIWTGEAYEALREGHRSGNYPSYCQGCDFLIKDPNVLHWTNHNRTIGHMTGTEFAQITT